MRAIVLRSVCIAVHRELISAMTPAELRDYVVDRMADEVPLGSRMVRYPENVGTPVQEDSRKPVTDYRLFRARFAVPVTRPWDMTP